MVTWKQASEDYEKKGTGSKSAGTTPPTSGMLSWDKAVSIYDKLSEEDYRSLGQKRSSRRQLEEKWRTERNSVNDWIYRYNRIMEGVSAYDKERNGGFTRDASGGYSGRIESLIADFEGIKGFAEQYGFQDSQTYLDQLKQLQANIGQINDSFSQFEDDGEYDRYKAYMEDLEEKRNVDLDAYSRDIAALERQLEDYDPKIDWTNPTERKQYDAGLKELEDEINRRKQYLTQARRIQKQDTDSKRFADIRNRDDFAENSGFNTGNQEIGYRYVNSDAAGRLDLEQQYGDPVRQFGNHAWDSLNEEEKQVYNYLMNTGDRQGAADYLRHLEESLQYRKGQEADAAMDALVAEDPKAKALRYAFMANAGYDQHLSGMQGMGNMIAGKDAYVPSSSTQVASGLVREDLAEDGLQLPEWLGGGSTGQMVGDLISTTANMAPSMAVGLISPNAGAAMMGASAAGSAYQEKLNEGYSKEQARKYGIAVGASETALGAALSGIKTLGGAVTNHVIGNALKGVKSGIGRFLVEFGGSVASEALEEGIQEILTPLFSNYFLNTDENVNWSEVAYSALLGGLSAGVLEGPTAVSAARNGASSTDTVTSIFDNVSDFPNNGTKASDNGTKPATGVPKMETVQQTGDIDSFARQFGTQAEAVKRNYLEGQDLQEYEVGFQTAYAMGLEGGKQEALGSVPYLSQSQREIAFSLGRDAAAAQKAAAPKKAAVTAKMTTEEGTQDVTIAEVVDMDDTTMTFRLEDGRTVTDNDLDFEKGQQMLSAAWELGMDAKTVNSILQDTAGNAAADADLAAGIQEAHHYGQQGYTMEQLTKHGTDAAILTDGQRKAAWEAGRKLHLQKVEAAPGGGMKVSGKTTGVWFDAGGGDVRAIDSADLSGLSEAAVAGVRAAQVLQKIGIGRNYYFYESYVNQNNERVYKDEKGQERKAPNGWYDPDGSIHIDLNAGANGNGLTLYTLSHELTHYVEKWSPKKHQALADFLVSNYAKAGNVDAMVAEKQAQLSESRGSAVSYEEAYSEFVADSMEAMLADGNVLEKLQELKKTDKSLFDKIREFFDNLARKIREIYKDLTPDSLEGKTVLQMKDQIDQIQQLFAEALTEASENFQAAAEIGLEVDMDTESVSPAVLYSERTWRESDYVQERNQAAKEIAKAINVTEKKARQYIDSVNSIAKMIAEDRTRLDYFSSPGRSSFIGNVEYGGSFDFSTLCKKRRLLTGTFTAIQKALPNTALTANEILDIRNRMKDAGLEVSCGLCYVEGSRANMGQFAKEFLRLYKQYYPDAWQPNMADVNTPDGIEWVRINHPECYEQYEYFWNHYGTLKAGDKNLFASQQKPKLYQLHTEYKGEILQKFKGDDNVEEKNLNGGIRLQSFSDFEIVHLIDTMQIIMDMSRVGLAGQAYTKVPDFAWALGDTGLKINLSLIAKGVDENGNLIFDDIKGMPIAEAMKLRDRYSANVGTILVAFNDAQLMAAMADDRVDFIIPFHRSQWKKSQYEAMGLPAKTKDYTFMQNEKFIKPQYHEYRGRMVRDKATNYMPNEYWDFSKSGKENAEAYLQMCARNNKRPKFYKLLENNGDGSYSLKADGSTDGYWKLLIDFKMYDNEGNGSPQAPVQPEFNMAEATRMLESYQGGHSNFPVAQGIVDAFVQEYKQEHPGRQFSDRKTANRTGEKAPTFYSYMGTVVAGMKQEKFGAASVVNMLRGKGVKAEEIKWSGIEAWLEGKKSVTKAELQEFIAGSMLQIEDEVREETVRYTEEQRAELDALEAENERLWEEVSDLWEKIFKEMVPISIIGSNNFADRIARKIDARGFGGDEDGKRLRNAAYAIEKNDLVIESLAANAKSENKTAKWSEYTIPGGENYREILFRIPESNFSNHAMQSHWDNTSGVIAHARVQDFGDMLFIEEIQSDWHNEGHKQGYADVGTKKQLNDIRQERRAFQDALRQSKNQLLEDLTAFYKTKRYDTPDKAAASDLSWQGREFFGITQQTTKMPEELANRVKAYYSGLDRIREYNRKISSLEYRIDQGVPDAPFRDNYHEFVLKRMIREAAEKGYGRLGWTTADIQSQRWSDEYAEGYRIEYDQDIPKFLNKYGKKWGTRVGKTLLDNGTEVWSMEITDSMKDSVLHEGQVLYQARATGTSNRDLLAGAFEDLARSPAEMEFLQKYQENIGLLNEQEAKLQEIRTEIRELTFGKGPKDPKRLEQLQEEAGKTANRIHIYDKKLLQLEAAKPLRDVLDREREKVRKATRQKGQEALETYREKRKESASKKDARRKIRKTIAQLNKLLTHGNKKQNIKKGMEDFAATALASAEILFTDNISNEDMILNGIGTQVDARENRLIEEVRVLLQKRKDLYSLDTATREVEDIVFTGESKSYAQRMAESEKLDRKISENMRQLKGVFERERNRLNEATVSGILEDLAEAYRGLGSSDALYIRAATDERVYQHLKQLKDTISGTTVRDMSVAQLKAVSDAYTMVLTTIRNANKAFTDGRSIQSEAEQMVAEFRSGKIPEKALGIAAKKIMDSIGWNYEKFHYALDRVGSPTLTNLFGKLADSEDITMRDVQEAKAYQKEMVEKYHYNDWKIDQKIDRDFVDNTGKEFRLTLGELMALYAYSRRDGADRHIEYGGFKLGKAALTDPKPATTYKLSAEQLAKITGMLTEEQRTFAEGMQKYLSETMGAKGNEVSMKLYGIEMFKEENYFPLHIAGEFKAQAQESQAKAAAGFQTMSNAGFTQTRNKESTAPIVLEDFMSVWADHVNEMARYHGAVPALEDIRRVMNYSVYSDADSESVSVEAAMTNAFGKQAVQYFDNLYREANSGAITDKLDAAPKKMLSLFRKNAVAYSVSVWIQQPASIYRARMMVDRKYFGRRGFFTLAGGVLRILNRKKWNAAYEEMMRYAPGVTMAKEIGGFDTSTGSSIRSYLMDTGKSFTQSMKNDTVKNKAKSVLNLVDDNAIANLPNVMDKVAWIEMWEACKRETVAKNPKMETDNDAFMEKVGQRFTEVIRGTQVYDSMFAKSPMLKTNNLFVQSAVSFMNEPNTVANMAEAAIRDLTRGNKKQAAKTAAALVTSIVVNELLKSIVYAMRDDDEDETLLEKYISAVAGSLIDDVTVFNYVPFARDVWSVWQGYDAERADMAIVSDAVNAVKKLAQLSSEDAASMTEDKLVKWNKEVTDASWAVAETLSPLFGIPLKNIRRDILAVFNAVKIRGLDKDRQSTALSIQHTVEEAIWQGSKSSTDRLYEAMAAGDDAYVQRLKAGYESDTAYHSAVKLALRDHDSRIWEAAVAWNNNDLDKYKRIALEIIREKHFIQDDVVLAIRAEASSMQEKESSSSSTVKGYFTSEKFGVALGQNNTAMADIIRQDLIDTAMANGKTRDEAEETVRNAARTQLKELYTGGAITGTNAEKMLVKYGGYDRETASEKVAEWQFEKNHPELDGRITYTQYKRWEADGKSRGVALDTFTDVAEYQDSGTSGSNRSQAEVADYINRLPISTAQKDALWCCFWKESTLYKNAPWH